MEKITLYSKSGCGQCVFLKRYLDSKGVSYQEKSVEDQNNLEEVKELNCQSLPVVLIGHSEPIVGFKPDLIERLLSQC
ncbi:glutaredoxin family protein [Facklamia miroungae]|uniref:Glutaredoxin-like protein NrdH n=1 Tax=Facklamia miroungae TaxID=120956 RepID=A0A1G7QRT6_9LACT|nr:glutaredoxin family protein [Facklamia miroungae]NKZ29017.1 glutaredoxin family protein [Facklamia miroungae]SDG00370.1 glutaredoxin-like protein NrdH [Facklamia miroungae]